MYENIMIIGIGSLGSHIANSICNIEKIKELTIVDHDIIETKNLKNTIYRKRDIGKLKIDALEEIIKNNKGNEVKIIKSNEKYLENISKNQSEYDLVIDCRDYTYNRGKHINIRPYISSRYLIIDCRKNISYEKKYKGKYLTKLTKTDFGNASLIISTLIDNGQIYECIKNQGVYKFDLDYLKQSINLNENIIYDSLSGEERFINLAENIFPILKINNTNDIKICVGSKDTPVYEKLIPKKSLINSDDVIMNLISMINSSDIFNNYVVFLIKDNQQNIIELIPETGAA